MACPSSEVDTCGFTDPEGAVLLDGENVPLVKVENEPYEVRGVEGNPATSVADVVEVVDVGWWATLDGLAPGQYELVLFAESAERPVKPLPL